MDVGPPELIIILVIILVIFGGAKLPQLARSLGQAKNEFEKVSREGVAGSPAPGTEPETVTLSKAEYDALQTPPATTGSDATSG